MKQFTLKHAFPLSFASLIALSLAFGACGGSEENDTPSYDDDPIERPDGGSHSDKPDAGSSDAGTADDDKWPTDPKEAYAAFYNAMPAGAVFHIRKSDSRDQLLLGKGKDGSITLARRYSPDSTTCAGLIKSSDWEAWSGHTNYWVLHDTKNVKINGEKVEVDDWTTMTFESPDLDPATNPLHLTLHNTFGRPSTSTVEQFEKMLTLNLEFESSLGDFMTSSWAKKNAVATGQKETIAGLECATYRSESLMDFSEWCIHEETGLTLRHQTVYTYGDEPTPDMSSYFIVTQADFNLASADEAFQKYGKFCKVIDEAKKPEKLADIPKVTQGFQGQGWAPIPGGYIPWKYDGIDFVTLIRGEGNGRVNAIHVQFLPGLTMMDQINEYIQDLVQGGQTETKNSIGCEYKSLLGSCEWEFTGDDPDECDDYFEYQINSHSVVDDGPYTTPAEPYSITAQFIECITT